MKVQLFTQTTTHGESTRVAGKFKPVISFRKNRPASTSGGSVGGDSYTMTSAHNFSVGQIVKYGDNFYKVTNQLNSLAYIYQYRLEVSN